MTDAQRLADFVVSASYEDISREALVQLKLRLLDSLGCAVGARNEPPVRMIRAQIEEFGGNPLSTLIGGGKTSPSQAAFYNSALVRYLDFNDSYMAPGETCHPSDNLGAVLSAAEYKGASGKDLLTALAVAYQVQCRLSDVAPVRSKGFDHTTQGSFALAAGVSKALGLNGEQTTNAVAISGTAFNALRVTRTGELSHWKGLAYPNAAFCCSNAAFLAMRGVTGPKEVFEGNKGFMESISGKFVIDWSNENLERVTWTILKKYNAEIHSQSAIEGALELQAEHCFSARDVDSVEIDIFQAAYDIIGGGVEGDKTRVRTKEEADHSLKFLVAVALLDGKVMPEEYAPERIIRDDVQRLLKKVIVRPSEKLTRLFPERHACGLTVRLKDGRTLTREKTGYEGFRTSPMGWERVEEKFIRLTGPFIDARLQADIIGRVKNIEGITAAELMEPLSKAARP
ncbi:MAG: MmgE/PrpD family protein [Deltaproteobacteria bacterium]|nr:MmgE/PrpD family protein [Deltaproteobacteria bacterium]